MKEIDDFLPRWVTPTLSPLGYRKSAHTYRKQFDNGDWAVLSFRGYPLGTLGSFLVDASFIPVRLLEWFNFACPSLAMKRPTGWWMDWSNPVKGFDGSDWRYDTAAEREVCASLLIDRLTEVVALFDRFAADPDLLVSTALEQEPTPFPELPNFMWHLRRPVWRAALLVDRGRSAELEQAMAAADSHPALRLRKWADECLRANGA